MGSGISPSSSTSFGYLSRNFPYGIHCSNGTSTCQYACDHLVRYLAWYWSRYWISRGTPPATGYLQEQDRRHKPQIFACILVPILTCSLAILVIVRFIPTVQTTHGSTLVSLTISVTFPVTTLADAPVSRRAEYVNFTMLDFSHECSFFPYGFFFFFSFSSLGQLHNRVLLDFWKIALTSLRWFLPW